MDYRLGQYIRTHGNIRHGAITGRHTHFHLREVLRFLVPFDRGNRNIYHGSGTSANILFGKLQAGIATNMDIDPSWLAAANTTGTTAGKIISPQSIAIAASACQLQGQEGGNLKTGFPIRSRVRNTTGIIVFLG